MLRTLLVTVFFSSIGMLADPVWIVENIGLTAAVAASVIGVKALICFVALRCMRQGAQASLAAALCLSQVGEFAFVIAETSRGTLIAGPGFDAGVWELWPVLAAGGALCIPPAELRTKVETAVRMCPKAALRVE